MTRNRRKVNNDASKSDVKDAASVELEKPKEKLKKGSAIIEIGQPNRMQSSLTKSKKSQNQVVTFSVKTRSMKKLEELLVANKPTSSNQDLTSNLVKEMGNTKFRKSTRKISSNKADASKTSLETEKAKRSKVTRSKSVDKTTMDHNVPSNTTRERETTSRKIIKRTRSVSAKPSKENDTMVEVRKSTPKIRSKSADVSKRALRSGKPVMEHTLSSKMKRDAQQTIAEKSSTTTKTTDAKGSKSARSKFVGATTMEHPISTSKVTKENKTITSESASAKSSKENNNMVETRKVTRKLRSKSVDVSKMTLGSEKPFNMKRKEQQISASGIKKGSGTVKETSAKRSKPTQSKSGEATTMDHTLTSNTKKEERQTSASGIVTRKRSATTNYSRERSEKVADAKRSRVSRAKSFELSTISTSIANVSFNSTKERQIISKGDSKSASTSNEKTLVDIKETDIKHESKARSQSVDSMEVPTSTARTTLSATKVTEEKAKSSKGTTKKILQDENAINSDPPMEHSTPKTMENKVEKATTNGSISKVTLRRKMTRTEGTKAFSKQSNVNGQQQYNQKNHPENTSDAETSHSIIGTPLEHSTPYDKKNKNSNPPTKDTLGETSNDVKEEPKLINVRETLPAARLSMWKN